MNAIEDNSYRRSWQALGAEFGLKWPKPQLILCISAHWLTQGWQLTAMAQPKTIHDFGGFPQALFDQQYPAPGFPAAAEEISKCLKQPGTNHPVALDTSTWGLDHGTWSVLQPMFPAANIPVIQLSMDLRARPQDHFALGQQLKALRSLGVLIVGSGNMVHNLRAIEPGAASTQAYDWAIEFDQTVASYLENGDFAALQLYQSLKTAALAHPTAEHFWPLLYTAGAVDAHEVPHFFNANYQAASIAMRSVVWGG